MLFEEITGVHSGNTWNTWLTYVGKMQISLLQHVAHISSTGFFKV